MVKRHGGLVRNLVFKLKSKVKVFVLRQYLIEVHFHSIQSLIFVLGFHKDPAI